MSFPNLPFGCLRSRRGLPILSAQLRAESYVERDKSMFARLISRNPTTILPSSISRSRSLTYSEIDRTMFSRLIANSYGLAEAASQIAGKYLAYWAFDSIKNDGLGTRQWNDSTPNNRGLVLNGGIFNQQPGLIGNGANLASGGRYELPRYPPDYVSVPIPLASYPYFVFTGWFKFNGVYTLEDVWQTSGRQFTPESYLFQMFRTIGAPNSFGFLGNSITLQVLAVPGTSGADNYYPPGGMNTSTIRINFVYGDALASIDIDFTNSWVFVYAELDVINKTLTLKVNNSSNTRNGSGSPYASFANAVSNAREVGVSGYNNNGNNSDFTVLIDEVGFANDRLTPEEISQIYNSGIGRTYPFT